MHALVGRHGAADFPDKSALFNALVQEVNIFREEV